MAFFHRKVKTGGEQLTARQQSTHFVRIKRGMREQHLLGGLLTVSFLAEVAVDLLVCFLFAINYQGISQLSIVCDDMRYIFKRR